MDSNKLYATILVFSLLAYTTANCPPPPTPKPTPPPKPKPTPPPKTKPTPPPSPKPTPPKATPPTPKPAPTPPTPKPAPTPPTPKPAPTPPTPKPAPTPPTPAPTPPTPTPAPTPPTPTPAPTPPTVTPPPPQEKCPKDTLKLGACADLLGLVNIIIGTPPSSKCCALIKDLADLEAALCLCTAIKANVLGINLNVPVTLSLILSACEKTVPPGFQCP